MFSLLPDTPPQAPGVDLPPPGPRRFDAEDVVLGVGDRFAEERFGVRPHRGAPGGGVIGVVHEGHRDAQLGQGVMEQVVGAAVEGGTGDDVITGLGDVQQGDGFRRLAARHQQSTNPSREGSEPFLHRRLGGFMMRL